MDNIDYFVTEIFENEELSNELLFNSIEKQFYDDDKKIEIVTGYGIFENAEFVTLDDIDKRLKRALSTAGDMVTEECRGCLAEGAKYLADKLPEERRKKYYEAFLERGYDLSKVVIFS